MRRKGAAEAAPFLCPQRGWMGGVKNVWAAHIAGRQGLSGQLPGCGMDLDASG